MARHPTKNFRPDPRYYRPVEDAADAAGISVNVLLQALLREFAADPPQRLAALVPHLAALAAETPRRGRPVPTDRGGGVIFFVETDDGHTIGDPGALPDGQYRTATMVIRPDNLAGELAERHLTARYGPVPEDPTVNPALYVYSTFSDADGPLQLRATLPVQTQLAELIRAIRQPTPAD